MKLRQVAESSNAFKALLDVYEHRDEYLKELKRQNKKLIGVVGDEAPDELIIAAGYVPVKVCGKIGAPTKHAAENLENSVFTDMEFATMYDRLLDGTYIDLLEQVIISHPMPWNYRLFLSIREYKRQFPDAAVPPIYFLDFEGRTSLIDQERNIKIYKGLKEALESWSGKAVTDEAISKAIDICNENRSALEAFDRLRNQVPSRITGTEALIVIGAALFMEKEEYTRLVKELTAEAASWPEVDLPRIYFCGSDQHSTDIYERIENCGVNIVGEDHNWGTRYYFNNVVKDDDLVGSIVNRYMFKIPGAKATVKERVAALSKAVTDTAAQGVFFYFTRTDGYACWTYPSQRDMLIAKGVAQVVLSRQSVPEKYPEKVDEAVMQLKATINGGE